MAEKKKEEKKKADITLSDGRELVIDLYAVTIKEWRSMFDLSQAEEEGDKMIAKIVGLSEEEILSLLHPDYRLVLQAVIERAREPLSDPNSASESTSEE